MTGWDDKSRAATQDGPARPLSALRPSWEEKEGETDKRVLTSTSACPDAPSSVLLSPFNLGPDTSGGGHAVLLPGPRAGTGHGRVGGYLEGAVAGVRIFLFYTLCGTKKAAAALGLHAGLNHLQLLLSLLANVD